MKPAHSKILYIYCIALFFGLSLAGCSGGSSPAPEQQLPPPVADTPEDEETLYLGLTDAEGDFLEYLVTVNSVKLTRANGVVVETLPMSTTMDFAQYTEVTEFLTAASVPVGSYVSASLVLDYTQSSIQIEDADGNAIPAIVVDETGAPETVVELTVSFSDRDGFRITPGKPAHITLDFDLESSHVLDLEAMPATAELNGVLLADPILESPKERRARGLLASVDTDKMQFGLKLRPFYMPGGDFGVLPVTTTESTYWEINGVTYEGFAGLDELSSVALNTQIVTFGVLDIQARIYTAETVLAGSSVPYGEKDVVTGTVIARNNDELLLRGAVIVQSDFRYARVSHLPVLIGPDTRVTQVKSAFGDYSPADVSVGQRVTVLGELQNPSSDERSLDATDGHLRMQFSQVHGLVKQVAPMVIDTASINRVRAQVYDFAGTGIGSDLDAEADNYEISTGSLTLDDIDINDAVKIRGFAAPFGTAPEDFLAQTLGDVSSLPGKSRARWDQTSGASALIGIDEGSLVLDLSGSSRAWHLYSGGIPADMKAQELPWTLSPGQSGNGVFAIITRDSRQVFTRFDEFGPALLTQLSGGESIRLVRSRNILDLNTLNSTARRIVIFVN